MGDADSVFERTGTAGEPSLDGSLLEALLAKPSLKRIVLRKLTVNGDLTISEHRLEELVMRDVHVEGTLTLDDLNIEQLRLTGVRAARVVIRECSVEKRAVIHVPAHSPADEDKLDYGAEWGADTVDLERTSFAAGGALRFGAREVSLKRCVFDGATTILGDWRRKDAQLEKPQLRSLVLAVVGDATFIGWGLRTCRFYGATGLDEAAFAPSCTWLEDPKKRRVLFDEYLWRRRTDLHAPGTWFSPEHASPDDWPEFPRLEATEHRDLVRQADRRLPANCRTHRLSQSAQEGDPPPDREETFAAWEVEALYGALARAARARGTLALAADYAWGAHTMRLLASYERTSEGNRRLGDSVGRHLVHLFRKVGGLGLRARTPSLWLLCLVIALSLAFAFGGYREGGAFCESTPEDGSHVVITALQGAAVEALEDRTRPRAPVSTPAPAPSSEDRLILCVQETPGSELAALGGSFAVTVGLLTTTTRGTTEDLRPWATGVLGPARLLLLLLIGFIGLGLRNRVGS